ARSDARIGIICGLIANRVGRGGLAAILGRLVAPERPPPGEIGTDDHGEPPPAEVEADDHGEPLPAGEAGTDDSGEPRARADAANAPLVLAIARTVPAKLLASAARLLDDDTAARLVVVLDGPHPPPRDRELAVAQALAEREDPAIRDW